MTTGDQFPKRIQRSFDLLKQATDYAQQLERDPWEFAVEANALIEVGLSNADLRALHHAGYVEHGREITKRWDTHRKFLHIVNFKIDESMCLVLTNKGIQTARGEVQEESSVGTPTWDVSRCELKWGHLVIKRYRLPSPNQKTILTAFEEEGWPSRIDDPLPPKGEIDPKRRLSDTIKSLNKKQSNTAVRFMGDGSGCGVLWKPTRSEHASTRRRHGADPFTPGVHAGASAS